MVRRTTFLTLGALLALIAMYLGTRELVSRPVEPPGPDNSAPLATASLPEKGPLGRKVENFTLRDFRGKEHSLNDFANRKLIVVAFLGTTCPVAKLYGPRLTDLSREFEPRGVAFLGVNANAQDSLADVATYARQHKIPFPIVKDPDNALADRMGAMRTPEVFVLDSKRIIRYWGRIDDQYAIGVQRSKPSRRDLAETLHELLAGKSVSRPVTEPAGCLIGRVPGVKPHGEVTYTKQISRLLQKRCVECHRSGEIAPFPLTTYKEAAGWASMIREVVDEGRMPPWFADPQHGRFRNESCLTAAEKALLFTWIDCGCPEGDPADLPAAPMFASGWRIGQPELVIYMAPQPYTVPAEGEVEYQYFLVDPGFKEDKYLQAMEVRPGNAAVVHHALVLIVPPGKDKLSAESVGALIDYAPGMGPTILPPGTALQVRAGSKFLFQLHYTPNGSEQKDRSYLGLVFADPKTVRRRVRGGAVINPAINIPPGVANYQLTAEHVLEEEVLLLSMSPHLHLRGKAFRYEAVYPDGRREVLLDVPRYDFNWQLRYELAEPKRLPRGTSLVCVAAYDNSANNPANPDPTKSVGWGDQTSEEMLIGFFTFVVD
jgi:peroxiredoxin